MYTPPSDSRAMVDPTTLEMPSTREPLRLASRMASSVSMVSPLWLMASVTVPGSMMGLR
jgi:hypothetical protein